MLESIESPANVVAFRAVGTVERSDYESVLAPAVAELVEQHDEIRFVYVLGDDFDSYALSAAWEDAKLGLGNLTKWKRVAVVTDHEWLHKSLHMLGWMVPGEVKTFGVDDVDAAIAWAAAD
jgi:hypothetical protein